MRTVLSSLFSSDKTKRLFTPWKPGLIKKSKYGFLAAADTFGSYLFYLIVFLKSDFNRCNSFALSWVHKVATGS